MAATNHTNSGEFAGKLSRIETKYGAEEPPIGGELKGGEPTIWVTDSCPFRKTGSPILGTMGRDFRSVVVMELATWKRLCAENPGLQTTLFRVGTI